jgi:thioredoxin-dependent peroxiredoxin
MLRAGDLAPDFAVTVDGQKRHLAELLTRGPVVLYFYPADFTRVCTSQACMFRGEHAELAARGVQVIGVSPQDGASHERFSTENNLPFPLIADTDRTIIRDHCAAGWLGTKRVTYLIGTDGHIQDAVSAMLSAGPHADVVARILKNEKGRK